MNGNVWIPIKISLKFVPKGPINIIPAMFQIMAWRRPGDKSLSEAMLLVYRRIYASLGLIELNNKYLLNQRTLENPMAYLRMCQSQIILVVMKLILIQLRFHGIVIYGRYIWKKGMNLTKINVQFSALNIWESASHVPTSCTEN